MDSKTICQVLGPLFDLESGGTGNFSYQRELATLIQATGKSARDLTVGELLSLCDQAAETYHQLCEQGAI